MTIKALFCDPSPNEARPPPLGWGSDFRPPPLPERNFSSKNPARGNIFTTLTKKTNPTSFSGGGGVLIALTHQRTHTHAAHTVYVTYFPLHTRIHAHAHTRIPHTMSMLMHIPVHTSYMRTHAYARRKQCFFGSISTTPQLHERYGIFWDSEKLRVASITLKKSNYERPLFSSRVRARFWVNP